MDFSAVLEQRVSESRFSINSCTGMEDSLGKMARDQLSSLQSTIGNKNYKYIYDSIIRNAFLIELVNSEIKSTKFQVRWTPELPGGDPRFASYEECSSIAEKIVNQISALSESDLAELCKYREYNSIPYELPIDYTDRFATHLHSVDNTDLNFGEVARRAIGLRELLANEELNPDADVFRTILKDKIKTKTYLTDRAQTGPYQTNREKRWETHPNSVQYALRTECLAIESSLLLQVAQFEGATPKLVEELKNRSYLPKTFGFATCPITGETLSYKRFVDDVLNPSHGKSPFQVGHLNPLKTVNSGESFGHVASNISWISEDGNRIQGSLSLDEVDALLIRTYINRDFAPKVQAYLNEKK